VEVVRFCYVASVCVTGGYKLIFGKGTQVHVEASELYIFTVYYRRSFKLV